jgi:hypothetical protein
MFTENISNATESRLIQLLVFVTIGVDSNYMHWSTSFQVLFSSEHIILHFLEMKLSFT